ncbi:MAG TPA: hypothetical protein V6D03_03625 [Candidatus Caenarcaniphilales bacterium]
MAPKIKRLAAQSELQKVLLDRQKKLGWTNYRLAVEYEKLFYPDLPARALATKYQTTVNQVLENPDTCYFITVQSVLKAMQGNLSAQFTDVQEVKLS